MPCDYSKYPKNWKTEIRPRILKRAGDKCEQCARPNGTFVYVWANGWWYDIFADEMYTETGERITRRHSEVEPDDEPRLVKTVLTISHTDHDVSNNDDSNLRALCQRCHLRHDAVQHATSAAETRRKKKLLIQPSIFEGVPA